METKVLNLQARYELFPPNRSSAREINVDASGGGINSLASPLIEFSGDFSSIQAAIESASAGDHILVHPGTYREFIIVNKPVHVKGIGRYAF